MRKLMWFTLGMITACGLCAYGMMYSWLPPVGLGCIAAGLVAVVVLKKPAFLRITIALLAGCAFGLSWFAGYYLLYLKPALELDGQKVPMTITAGDYSYETSGGTGVDGRIMIEGRTYRVRVYLNEETSLAPGDRITGTFRLRITAPDAENPSTYFQGKGIFLIAGQTDAVQIQEAEAASLWDMPAVWRRNILQILDTVMPSDTAAFSKALLLGDTQALDYATETAFRICGIRHIVAVSGLHISLLYGLISVLTLRKRYFTALMGIPVLFLFAAVAGFTPSVVRSAIMVCLMLAAMVFEREYDGLTALSASLLMMLVVNPLAVTSVGLQMSAACVAGILLLHQRFSAWLASRFPKKKGMLSKAGGMLRSGISITVSAMSLVTPLSAGYFGAVSFVGILSNLLTLWAVNLTFSGLVVVCLLYFLWEPVAVVLAGFLAWPIRYVLLAAKTLASIPLAAVYTRSIYIVSWLLFVYLLLVLFLFMKKKQVRMLLCCGVLSLCVCLLASWAEPMVAGTRITMLDVGQGQAILLQSEGKTFLVDCGGDDHEKTADIVAETVLSQGITRLDGIILTHYDDDHAGAIRDLLTRVGTDYLFLPDTVNDFEIPEMDGRILYIWEDLRLNFGDTTLSIYGPVYSGMDNENSLCVLFDTEKCDILITGDRSGFGERMLLRRTPLQDVDILVAGHHGAADSSSEELLNAVTPETVLISVAEGNVYGHPDDALLQRLADRGCTVLRTDLNGTITLRR